MPEKTSTTVHNFRKSVWGHSLDIRQPVSHDADKPARFTAVAFVPHMAIDDLVLLNSMGKTGAAYYKVVELRTERDPADMHWITIEFVEPWEPEEADKAEIERQQLAKLKMSANDWRELERLTRKLRHDRNITDLPTHIDMAAETVNTFASRMI